MDNLIPYENTVVRIPIGMDCRELKFRIRDAGKGSFVLYTYSAKVNELQMMHKGSK